MKKEVFFRMSIIFLFLIVSTFLVILNLFLNGLLISEDRISSQDNQKYIDTLGKSVYKLKGNISEKSFSIIKNMYSCLVSNIDSLKLSKKCFLEKSGEDLGKLSPSDKEQIVREWAIVCNDFMLFRNQSLPTTDFHKSFCNLYSMYFLDYQPPEFEELVRDRDVQNLFFRFFYDNLSYCKNIHRRRLQDICK